METLNINLPTGESYPIFIGYKETESALASLSLGQYSKFIVIRDHHLPNSFLPHLKNVYPDTPACEIVIPSGEDNKNIVTVGQVWKNLLKLGCDRKSLIVNYGGGLTTDLGGFVASTFMRGVDFIHVPTTLLADVDASVGGKVGVNFSGVKNIIGAFQQPRGVVIDVSELETLPERELRSGFAEMIKHSLIMDEEHYRELKDYNLLMNSLSDLIPLIKRSCEIKAKVVVSDEKEKVLRNILNFGHTFGHAIEMESYHVGKPLLHGEAVAIGMVVATLLSKASGGISSEVAGDIVACIEKYKLPTKIGFETTFEKLLELMSADKKSEGGELCWTLLSKLGQAEYNAKVERALLEEIAKTVLS